MTQDDKGTADELTEVEKLRQELKETRKAQSGSDRRVQELTAKLAEYEKAEGGELEQLSATKKLMERKMQAIDYAKEKGITAEEAFNALGLDGEKSDLDRLDEYIDRMDQVRQEKELEFAKKHGRKVYGDNAQMGPTSRADLLNMSEDQLKRIPATVDYILSKEERDNKPTLRRKLWEAV